MFQGVTGGLRGLRGVSRAILEAKGDFRGVSMGISRGELETSGVLQGSHEVFENLSCVSEGLMGF